MFYSSINENIDYNSGRKPESAAEKMKSLCHLSPGRYKWLQGAPDGGFDAHHAGSFKMLFGMKDVEQF